MTSSDLSGKVLIFSIYGGTLTAIAFAMVVLFHLNDVNPRPYPDYGVPVGMAFVILFTIGFNAARALSLQGKRIADLEQKLAELKKD
ncbi:hypothetical protein KBB96_05460 [Luteolibacter ambystomatis]|uniref:Uncharacterized protein n=1 Tax=Luteolibacter ambystomatis TaxID=2824561 RepID=A0A975J1M8_9BACT|nr:hypothetical protein [Luteolibacter ambystomatis]QUE52337.1 hypothetical protein KBB96_05460 [Luteolibacter ambystomatis]